MLSLPPAKARSALLGALIGDAVGVPYEFHRADHLPEKEFLQMQSPPWFPRSHSRVPVGTWSDDGALMLALLDSLRQHPELDLTDFAQRMLAWYEQGRYTPDGVVFDIGMQTRIGLSNFRRGEAAATSGKSGEHDNGNGALMRTLACVLVPFADEQALLRRALDQGLPTHGHARSRVVCALYALLAWNLGDEPLSPSQALHRAQASLDEHLPAALRSELGHVLQPPGRCFGSGYVVDSFWSAWSAFTKSETYQDCIQRAILFGDDTDTTACIAGGLAGLRYAEESFPVLWRNSLQGRDLALSILG